jgi:hypothetical protein
MENRKIPSPCRDSNPPIIHPIGQRYTTELSRLPLIKYVKIIIIISPPPQ